MEKAGLKTFVYSFVFSLFTLFGVHGAYFYAPPKNSTETKIPSKNITLFFKDTSHRADIQSVPTKKIVLSVLPEISHQPTIADKIPLNIDEPDEAPMAELLTAASIPLQNSVKTHPSPQDTERRAEKIASNYEQIIKSPPSIVLSPAETNDSVIKDEAPLMENSAQEVEKPVQLAQKDILPMKDHPSEASLSNLSQEDVVLKQEALPTSKPDSTPNKASRELSIPLEKNDARTKIAKNEIKTTEDIEGNQVALNANNVPIKSMLDRSNRPKAPNLTDEKWQSMSEKYADKQDQNPWVVAKGGKFPRNEMVLQDSSYKKDEEEIRRILSANKHPSTNKAGTIKLASETVKNLLIPIPDEIMKEKNITPKLVSSDKNQSTEEELSARENFNEEGNQTDRPSSTPFPPAEEKKGGILNSLSSIFTGKKSAPQIGNSVEETQESKNSLLSAFTRKKIGNTNKILPTEIRLSFQPNRAEISGQTLKWIRAFAQKTAEETATGLEIRIDGTSSPLLQRRRLNLLHNILINEGADYSKIRTVFTAREPNSFILRTIRINRDNMNIPQNRNINTRNNYMQW